MKHLFRNTFFVITGVTLFTLIVLGGAFMTLSFVLFDAQNSDTVTAAADTAAANARNIIAEGGAADDIALKLMLISIARASQTHIIVVDRDGVVVNCSDEDLQCADIGKTVDLNALNFGDFDSSRNVRFSVFDDDCVIIASKERTPLLWKSFTRTFLFIAMFAMLVAALITFPLTRRQIAPVERMVKTLEVSEQTRRDFIANVSHELKTPITSIAGFAEALLDGTIPVSKQPRYLVAIKDEVNRLSRLVQRMLEITRYQVMNPLKKSASTFDVNELTRRALFTLEGKITAKQLTVEAVLPEEPLTVAGEEDAIAQVLYNVTDNAVKFADPGGTLTVRVWKTGGKAYVSVRDIGEPIPPDDLPYIFDRFHKSDRSRSIDKDGLGLGLHIAKSILDGYGETIYANSEDRVTEFVFTLTTV
ncbi:MAG: HAMP domain-containing histidine kinase [Oscillospiraceae bacterium]|jgi:signal transduction histidine kinase|nr:HAMP domain-containing histidine kinase [Oscillospiraceae bacterium]